MMDADRLRHICRSLRGAGESFPFDPETPVFKTVANNKVFAIFSVPGAPLGGVTVKCNPHDSEALRERYPAITPGYHMNKRHWITVALDGSVPDDLVVDIVTESYNLVRLRIRTAPSVQQEPLE